GGARPPPGSSVSLGSVRGEDRPATREGPLVDLQMAKVKARARPWRAIFALVLAAAAGIIPSAAGRNVGSWTGHGHAASKIVAASTAAAFCLLAAVGILGLAGRTRQALQPLTGTAHAAVIRYTIVLIGFILTLVLTLGLFKVPITQ